MIKDIIIFTILLVIVDAAYLKTISPEYSKMMIKIQGSDLKMKLEAAIVVYIAIIAVWYFFIYREMDKNSVRDNVIRAAVLGSCTYAIFDFTNLAIFDNYRLDLAIMDSIWGGVLFGLSTFLLHLVKQHF